MNYTAFLVYVIVSTFTPGPNNLMAMYVSVRNGVRGGSRFYFGAILGMSSLFVLCGVLNFVLSSFVPVIEPYMKWLGACYLLYLSFIILRGSRKGKDDLQSVPISFESGFSLQYVNVKAWLFGLTVFSL
jgi:cysteine/O-acetylserine efflux protein